MFGVAKMTDILKVEKDKAEINHATTRKGAGAAG